MPNVALHDVVVTNEELGVNTEPMAIVNDVFRNTLVDDTKYEDDISQLLRNVESEFLSDR
jgi:hypothetical protein